MTQFHDEIGPLPLPFSALRTVFDWFMRVFFYSMLVLLGIGLLCTAFNVVGWS